MTYTTKWFPGKDRANVIKTMGVDIFATPLSGTRICGSQTVMSNLLVTIWALVK